MVVDERGKEVNSGGEQMEQKKGKRKKRKSRLVRRGWSVRQQGEKGDRNLKKL